MLYLAGWELSDRKPEGSETDMYFMITTKITLDDTSTAIWSNLPSEAIHTIKLNGGVGSSRTAISLALIHEISESATPPIPRRYIYQVTGTQTKSTPSLRRLFDH